MTDEAKKIVDALRDPATMCGACIYHGEPNGCNRSDGSCNAWDYADDAADLIERLEEENERLHYTLQGVMHFVDKWIDDEPYYDIDDPDGKIAVNRAAEAREIALKAIEAIEIVKRERDAAVYDLSINANCNICENHARCAEWMSNRCAGFIDAGNASPFFEWRGVCAENSGGGANDGKQ